MKLRSLVIVGGPPWQLCADSVEEIRDAATGQQNGPFPTLHLSASDGWRPFVVRADAIAAWAPYPLSEEPNNTEGERASGE